MEDRIKGVVKGLRIWLAAVWALLVATAVVGECVMIPGGFVEDDIQMIFYYNTACIVLTLLMVPLSMMLFSLNTTKGLKRLDKEEALYFYRKWARIKMSLLGLCTIVDLLLGYYSTTDVTGLLCAMICLLMTFSCWTSHERLKSFVESVNNNQEN